MGLMNDVVSGWMNQGKFDAKQASRNFEKYAGNQARVRHQSVDESKLKTDVYGTYADPQSERKVWHEHPAPKDQVDIDFSKYR